MTEEQKDRLLAGKGGNSEIQGGRGMMLAEAIEIINEMKAYVNIALVYLQKQKFQYAFETGRRHIFGELEIYRAAIELLIERDRTDLLKRLCQKIYESACEAEPLLEQAFYNCKTIGETETKGLFWAIHIKAYWEDVVLPILQTDAEDVASPTLQTKAEAPHRGRPKDDSILWLVENPDGHLGVLHQLTDGKRGVNFFCFIKAAFLKGWFMRPSYGALEKEFGNRGVKSCYSKCMSDNNEKELEPLGEMIESRYQKL